MLPSVDSRLACRVILLLISTAKPVSVLLWMVLRNFLPPASAHRDTQDKKKRDINYESMQMKHNVTQRVMFTWKINDTPMVSVALTWESIFYSENDYNILLLCFKRLFTLLVVFVYTVLSRAAYTALLWSARLTASRGPTGSTVGLSPPLHFTAPPSWLIQEDSWLSPLGLLLLIYTQRACETTCLCLWQIYTYLQHVQCEGTGTWFKTLT